jgi:hypothetical protein
MHGTGMFDNPDIFYLDRPNFQGPWELSDQDLQKIKNHQLTIIDLSSEHWGANGIDAAYEKFNSLGINFLLLSHEPTDHKKYKRMLYYPHWYHYSVKNFEILENITHNKMYMWSCLNLNPRPHRIYNYMLSRSKPYFAQSKFSMFNSPEDWCSRDDDIVLDQVVVTAWQQAKQKLPTIESVVGKGLDLSIPELTDTYIHLVTESTIMPRVFITEKTWKPIAAQQLFLVFGNPGTVSALRQLGIDVFDDIIDHSYDIELDWSKRISMIHNVIETLLSKNLELIYQRTATRRKHNQEIFITMQVGKTFQHDLENTINQYL